MGIILFNTIRHRTIPNPQFAYQNFLIENRVLRFVGDGSGEDCHGIQASWRPPVFVCLSTRDAWALLCQARALQELIREQERVW